MLLPSNTRKLFAFAASILTLGNLICALAPSFPILVFGRMIQETGMSAISVLSVVAISKVFAEGKRGAALGIFAGCIGIGTAFRPIFGGAVSIVGMVFSFLDRLYPVTTFRLYHLHAIGYSDAFLATFSLIIALIAAFGLPNDKQANGSANPIH